MFPSHDHRRLPMLLGLLGGGGFDIGGGPSGAVGVLGLLGDGGFGLGGGPGGAAGAPFGLFGFTNELGGGGPGGRGGRTLVAAASS